MGAGSPQGTGSQGAGSSQGCHLPLEEPVLTGPGSPYGCWFPSGHWHSGCGSPYGTSNQVASSLQGCLIPSEEPVSGVLGPIMGARSRGARSPQRVWFSSWVLGPLRAQAAGVPGPLTGPSSPQAAGSWGASSPHGSRVPSWVPVPLRVLATRVPVSLRGAGSPLDAAAPRVPVLPGSAMPVRAAPRGGPGRSCRAGAAPRCRQG